MKHQRHFGNVSPIAPPETACAGNLITDLRRIVGILDCEVTAEEEQRGIFDRSDVRYPILARSLAARRHNLKLTIAALEARL